MQTLAHPRSGETLEGVRLPPGSVIRKNDKYDSSDGKWCAADIIAGGKVPMGDHVVWVRQPNPLSDNGSTLLGYINLKPWGEKTCIGERNGAFYVIPSPTFNWDGRFDIQATRVVHPECVQELVDHGYLEENGHKNRVYTLTDEGKREGARLLAQ